MATRLDKAIQELKRAAGDRPFVLVIDPTKSKTSCAFHMDMTTNCPYYTLLGLLHQGILGMHAILDRTSTSRTISTRPDEPEKWERDEARAYGLVMTALPVPNERVSENTIRYVLRLLNDDQMQELEHWLHMMMLDNEEALRDGAVPARPSFVPDDWTT